MSVVTEEAELSAEELEDPKGLALYRRKRPYSIDGSREPATWDVMDLITGEQLGRIILIEDEDDKYYAIDLASQIGNKVDKLSEIKLHQTYRTRWLAADIVWKRALPVRSRVWSVLKIGVNAMDWATRLFAIVVAFYSIWILFQAVIFTESSRLGQLSVAFLNALIRWFNTWGQANAG